MRADRLLGVMMGLSLACGDAGSEPAKPSSDSSVSSRGSDSSTDSSTDLGAIEDGTGLSEVGVDDTLQTDSTAPPVLDTVIALDTSSDAVVTPDVVAADVVVDTQSPDCGYTCDMNCQCKQDASGCDIEVCESDDCIQLMTTIDDLLPSLQSCSDGGDCVLFEFPICGSLGCFQRAVHQDADLTELSTLALEGQQAQCSSFHCGCWILGQPECIAGECTLVPVQE